MNIQKLHKNTFFEDKKIKHLELLENQGVCNKIYKLHTEDKIYCLRVFKHIHNQINHRKNEYIIQKKASKEEIAAKPYIFHKEFILCDFILGEHKSKLKNKDIKSIVKSLKKLHKINYHSIPYDLNKEFKSYKNRLKTKEDMTLISESLKELKKVKKSKKDLVLCHHDLNIYNIIFQNNKAFFIDWEFSCINDRFFDLASLCIEFKLTKKQEKFLLKLYMKKYKKSYMKKLQSYKKICTNLWILWFKALEK